MIEYPLFTHPKLGVDEKEEMQNSLLEYCKLDTLAMVWVLGVLREVGEQE